MKFKINDIVRIKNDGYLYPSYDTAAKLLNATKWKSGWEELINNKKGIVVNTCAHPVMDWVSLVLVDLGEVEVVIDELGLEFYKKEIREYNIAKFMRGELNGNK